MAGFNNLIAGIQISLSKVSQTVSGLGQVSNATARVTDQVKQLSNVNFSQIRYGFDQISRGIVPVRTLLIRGAQEALKFEESMGNIQKLMSPEEFKAQEGKIREITRGFGDIGVSAKEAAQGMESLMKTGVTPATVGIKEFTRIARVGLAAAAIEGTKPEQVFTILNQLTNLFGKSFEETSDIVITASNATNSTIKSMLDAFRYGGLAAQRYGFDLKELAIWMGAFHDVGLKGSQAGTTFARMLQALSSDTWKSVSNLKYLSKVTGVDVTELWDETTGKLKPLSELIKKIAAAYKLMRVDERQGLIDRIFGVRGGVGFAAIDKLLSMPDHLQRIGTAIAGAQLGTTISMAKAKFDNVYGSVKRVEIGLSNLANRLFESVALGPHIGKLASWIDEVGRAYTAMFVSGQYALDENLKFSESAMETARFLNSFLLSLKSVISSIITPFKWLYDMFSGSFWGNVTGKLFGVISALTAVGIAFGVVGLGFKGLKAALALVVSGFGATTVAAQGTQIAMQQIGASATAAAAKTGMLATALATLRSGLSMTWTGLAGMFSGLGSIAMAPFAAARAGGGLAAGIGAGTSAVWSGLALLGKGLLRVIPIVGLAGTVIWTLVDVIRGLIGETEEEIRQREELNRKIRAEIIERSKKELLRDIVPRNFFGVHPDWLKKFEPQARNVVDVVKDRTKGNVMSQFASALAGTAMPGRATSVIPFGAKATAFWDDINKAFGAFGAAFFGEKSPFRIEYETKRKELGIKPGTPEAEELARKIFGPAILELTTGVIATGAKALPSGTVRVATLEEAQKVTEEMVKASTEQLKATFKGLFETENLKDFLQKILDALRALIEKKVEVVNVRGKIDAPKMASVIKLEGQIAKDRSARPENIYNTHAVRLNYTR
jgi:TP901 family phage tail tape measure protein